jgi:hypothetical protein
MPLTSTFSAETVGFEFLTDDLDESCTVREGSNSLKTGSSTVYFSDPLFAQLLPFCCHSGQQSE